MNYAIILAGGMGKRMGSGKNKVLLPLNNHPLLYYSLKAFSRKDISRIVVVSRKEDISEIKHIISFYNFKADVTVGGKERQDSVFNGFSKLKINVKDTGVVVIHNGCNPFVSKEDILNVIKGARKYGAGVCAQPVKDTLKTVHRGFVNETLERSTIWHMQTPQSLKVGVFINGMETVKRDGLMVTDDVSLAELVGVKAKIVECSPRNFKITTKEDYLHAKALVEGNTCLVGYGKDNHEFSRVGKLVLGGVNIPGCNGLKAHSDGDVVLHAVFNAVSNALGKRSIGYYFPDTDEKNKRIDSSKFFPQLLKMLGEKKVNNLSVMIEAKKPKLEKHVPAMKKRISQLLRMDAERVGIILTSGEEMSSFGKGLGIQAEVYCTIK